jgi:hypothetical protein
VPPHSPVELAKEASSPLALGLCEALTRNAAHLGKLEGRVLVRAEDTGSAVTLDFANGRVRVSEGEPERARIRILGDEDAILALTRMPFRRLPAVWSPSGRQVLKRQLGGELTIRGLVLRSPSVLRLLRLLSA